MDDRSTRRYEVAKEVLPWMLEQLSSTAMVTDSKKRQLACAAAVETADLLLDELEKEEK